MRALERWPWLPLACLLALGAIDRAHLLFAFSFQTTGTDEVILWQMARDYGNGLFHEWYMYGQNYNPMLEALLAAPFVRLGGAPWIVLPIVTSLLALLPFWSFALWHHRRGECIAALVFAALPILLRVEWGILTSIPRGFVHGLAIASLLPWALSAKNTFIRFFLSALIAGTAVLCNPNASVLLVALLTPVLIAQWKRPLFWLVSAAGLVLPVLFWWKAHHFFDDHRWDLMHWLEPADLAFHPRLLMDAVHYHDSYFGDLLPLAWRHGALMPVVLLGIAFLLFRRRPFARAWGFAAAVVVVLLALCVVKVHNGYDTVFYTRARMFLALPVLIAWGVGGIVPEERSNLRAFWLVFAVISVWAGFKWSRTGVIVRRELAHQEPSQVLQVRLDDLRHDCAVIAGAARATQADVVVPIRWPRLREDQRRHFMAYLYCYGCPCLQPELPPTLGPGYDRRSWVRDRYRHAPAGTVLFVGGDPTAGSKLVTSSSRAIVRGNGEPLLRTMHSDSLTIDTLMMRYGLDDDPWN